MPTLLLWLACTPDAGTPTIVPDTGDTTTFTLSGDLPMTDSENYTYTGTWGFPAIEVRPSIELFFSWDTVTADAWGVVREPTTFATLYLFEISGTDPETEAKLALDDLDDSILNRWSTPAQGLTEARLSDFGTLDLTEDAGKTWLLALADDDGARIDLRDGLVLVPKDAQTGTLISIPNGGSSFEFLAKLDGETLRTDEGKDAYTFDWSALTLDGYGKPFDSARSDELFIGRFDDVGEPDDLGGRVLELESRAAAWWTLPTPGTSASLSGAVDASGAPFDGFTADTVWLVGGRCTTCLGPAPSWLVGMDIRLP